MNSQIVNIISHSLIKNKSEVSSNAIHPCEEYMYIKSMYRNKGESALM